jgi:hypothetical protein
MSSTGAQIAEAHRLAERAQAQVDSQEVMILRMRALGLSTEVATGALRTLSIIRDQMVARLKSMNADGKSDSSSNERRRPFRIV